MTDKSNANCLIPVTGGIDATKSLANSVAIMAWPTTHKDWVRPGDALLAHLHYLIGANSIAH